MNATPNSFIRATNDGLVVSRYCCLVSGEEIEVVAVKISRRNHVLAGDELYSRLVELVVLCSLVYGHETFALETRNFLRGAAG